MLLLTKMTWMKAQAVSQAAVRTTDLMGDGFNEEAQVLGLGHGVLRVHDHVYRP